MSGKARYVFDTNVVVSALLFRESIPGQAFFYALERGTLLASRHSLTELSQVFSREKFDRYVTREERERLLASLIAEAETVEPGTSIAACRDPHDDALLELAVAGGAAAIVTGDRDLLVMTPFQGIPIVTPSQFLESLGRGN